MKIFKRQVGLINSDIRKTKITNVSLDYNEDNAYIFIHYADGKVENYDYETNKDALHDFLILIKKIKLKGVS